MTKYKITLYSKNKESLDHFLKFLKYSLKIQKVQEPLNYLKKKKERKRISVLTSPHVNKTAQEQFEYTVYSIKLTFYSYRTKKCLVLLKRIKNQLFPDINMKVSLKGSVENRGYFLKKISLNPNNFTFNLSRLNYVNQKLYFKKINNNRINVKNANLLKKTSHYLELLSWYGI